MLTQLCALGLCFFLLPLYLEFKLEVDVVFRSDLESGDQAHESAEPYTNEQVADAFHLLAELRKKILSDRV